MVVIPFLVWVLVTLVYFYPLIEIVSISTKSEFSDGENIEMNGLKNPKIGLSTMIGSNPSYWWGNFEASYKKVASSLSSAMFSKAAEIVSSKSLMKN